MWIQTKFFTDVIGQLHAGSDLFEYKNKYI